MINREEYVQKLKHQIEQWNAQMAQWEATSRDAKDRYMKQLEQFRDKRDAAILGVAARRFPLRHLRVPLLDLVLQLLHVLFAVDHGVLLGEDHGILSRSTADSAICRSGTVQ